MQGYDHAIENMYLRKGVVERLIRALEILPSEYGFVILDAWRPLELQREFYFSYHSDLATQHPNWTEEELKNAVGNFVAYPSEDLNFPPPHLTGGAVDITLANREGVPLGLGTPFDDFTEKAQTDYFENKNNLTEAEIQARDYRRMLVSALESVGFSNYPGEWWHFDYGNNSWARRVGKKAIYKGILG